MKKDTANLTYALTVVQRWSKDAASAREKRDTAILYARNEHHATLRQIAAAAGMTPAGVAKVLDRLEHQVDTAKEAG